MKLISTIEQTKQFSISTRLLMQEALRKGYTVSFYDSSPTTKSGITHIEKKGREAFFKSTCTALTPCYGYFAAEDKLLTCSLLSAKGINTPATQALAPEGAAEELYPFLEKYKTVVVKPVNMNHGDGVSIGIVTRAKLKQAVKFARESGNRDSDILVQEQVMGKEYRFLVVDGKVIAVAGRRPASVIGDGSSTIRQLVEAKNKDPRRGEGHESELTLIDLDEIRQHKGKDFLQLVLKESEAVNVLDTSNLSKGGESIDFTDIASPALKKLAADAANACFLGVAGVDIMTQDITAEKNDGSNVIEVNLAPGIRMHQFPSIGEKRDVAKIIFNAIEKTTRPIGKKIIRVGRSEEVLLKGIFPSLLKARIDTGATYSTVWASNIKESSEGLEFCILDKSHKQYTGEILKFKEFRQRAVSNSTGHIQVRYTVKIPVKLKGRTVLAQFTLADRSTQVYPVLIGRNVLRNNFVVDVFFGKKDITGERNKRKLLNKQLESGKI